MQVEELTDWVSSLTYSWKANGKLIVYLDPCDINKAIKRDHNKTPTVEEIMYLLAGSMKFTKVDGTSSDLCIVHDYESSLLTTFNTPWGKVQVWMPSVGPIMCPGYLLMDDEPDSGML